tara:strand:- start:4499 stop:4813 length:315 start_codon:yes stop_codon:yes gene_type:complete
MEISNEQLINIIEEEIEEVIEGYIKKYGTGEDFAQRRARQNKSKIKHSSGEVHKILTPIDELEAKMAIGVLKRDPRANVRVSEKIYNHIKQMDPSLLDRVEIKE